MRGRGDSSWAMYPAGSQTRIQEAASLTVLPSVSYSLLSQPKATVGDETTESTCASGFLLYKAPLGAQSYQWI